MQIEIGKRWIVGDGFPVYCIAEIGQNHQGDVYVATRLAAMAADCGAQAVKLQKRDLSCELTREAGQRPHPDAYHAFGESYLEHREKLELTAADLEHLKARIEYNRWPLDLLCTACDIPSAKLVQSVLDPPAWKIASRDLDNLPLVDFVARYRRPVILSTGFADEQDIAEAVDAVRRHHNQIILLQCVSKYPCEPSELNLAALPWMRQTFDCLVGLSDHTVGVPSGQSAVDHGACMLEKHITFSRAAKGSDHAGALEKHGLELYVRNARMAQIMHGQPVKQRAPGLEPYENKLRRSLVTRVTLPAGSVIQESDLHLKCPGDGLRWRERDLVVGHRTTREIPEDTVISLADVHS